MAREAEEEKREANSEEDDDGKDMLNGVRAQRGIAGMGYQPVD